MTPAVRGSEAAEPRSTMSEPDTEVDGALEDAEVDGAMPALLAWA
jgi:hypothetical protein